MSNSYIPQPPVGGTWPWTPPGLPPAPSYSMLTGNPAIAALGSGGVSPLPAVSTAIPMPAASSAAQSRVFAMPAAPTYTPPAFSAPSGFAAPMGQTAAPSPGAQIAAQTAASAARSGVPSAASAGAVRNLAPGAGVLEGGISLTNGSRVAAAAGRAGRMLTNPFVAPFVADPFGDWVEQQTGSSRLGGMVEMGGTGALAGARWGLPGAIAGGVAGGVAGALGVNLEDIPFVGGLFGAEDGDMPDGDDIQEQVNAQYARVLGQYGASEEFIRRAQNQFVLAWQIQGGEEGLPAETVNALAADVLNGMLQQWQVEQAGGPVDPYGDAREQLEQEREYELANIAAAQAWMQPLMTEMLNKQQWYADQYRDISMAMAEQVSDPAVSTALQQMATQYSSDQAVQNAIMLQQAALAPETVTSNLNAEYERLLEDLAYQEALYNAEILAAGGTLPGSAPIIGGIPLAPAGSLPSGGSDVTWINGVPVSTNSNVIDLRDPETREQWDAAHAGPYSSDTVTSAIPPEAMQQLVAQASAPPASGAPPTGTVPTTAPPSESAPWTTPSPVPLGPPAPGQTQAFPQQQQPQPGWTYQNGIWRDATGRIVGYAATEDSPISTSPLPVPPGPPTGTVPTMRWG